MTRAWSPERRKRMKATCELKINYCDHVPSGDARVPWLEKFGAQLDGPAKVNATATIGEWHAAGRASAEMDRGHGAPHQFRYACPECGDDCSGECTTGNWDAGSY
jgi:hypothetical protein